VRRDAVIDLPSNDQSPRRLVEAGQQVEERRLAGPVGPISAVIEPRWTSTCSTSTAMMPPKLRTMPCGDEDRSGFGTPGSGSRRQAPPRAAAGRDSRAWARQRPSNAISLRLPKTPCGRNAISSIEHQPDQLNTTWPIWVESISVNRRSAPVAA
jgi:hypothetical protein